MRRHGLGRRAFRLDDGHTDPAPGAAAQARRLESMPRIHILRSRRTVREIRLPDNAQQKKNGESAGMIRYLPPMGAFADAESTGLATSISWRRDDGFCAGSVVGSFFTSPFASITHRSAHPRQHMGCVNATAPRARRHRNGRSWPAISRRDGFALALVRTVLFIRRHTRVPRRRADGRDLLRERSERMWNGLGDTQHRIWSMDARSGTCVEQSALAFGRHGAGVCRVQSRVHD